MDDYRKQLANLALQVIKQDASDLHLSVRRRPTLRVNGELLPLLKEPILTPEDTENFMKVMLGKEEQERLLKEKEIDFAYSYGEKARFRCNIYMQRGVWSIAMRLIIPRIRTFKELNLPESLKNFAFKEQGFFLVAGPTGHGKSTTLAAMVDAINHELTRHIITIEDPIEYLFAQDRSIIDQREVRYDTLSFHRALRSVFRQDIDVAMIGEMRDPLSMAIAVTAAETGHLVLSSLHTNNASQTIDRIIDSFPAAQQNQIRIQLAGSLLGIFSQRLVPRISGGRIPAYELLIVNTAVRNLIRESRTHEIDIVIETSSSEGMVSLNSSLADLVSKKEITMEHAMAYSLKPKGLAELMA
jgi:twitching motility protein PilT